MAAAGSADAATITVQNKNASGPGSLVAAIDLANDDPNPDTINFAPSVTGSIQVAGSVAPKYATTIDGPGAAALTISGTPGQAVVFPYPEPGDLVIEGLTLEGGGDRAIYVSSRPGSVTVRDSVLSGAADSSGADGGGIYARNVGAVRLERVTVTGSEADGAGGGLFAIDTPVTVESSTFDDNGSNEGGGGIFIGEGPEDRNAALTVRDSLLAGNTSFGNGGGISADAADGPVSIQRSTISGGFTPGRGAGIYIGYTDGPVTLDSSTVNQNGSTGTNGGGIFAFAPEGPLTIRNSTIANNPSRIGGGLYWFNYFDTDATIANSTITGNSATGSGGGIFRYGYDGSGPSYEGPDSLTLSSSVVAGNTTPYAEGTDLSDGYYASGPGSFVLDHTLIGNTAGATVTQSQPGTNLLNVPNPRLGPLASNGGPTQTMLPLPESPLLDAGAPNGLRTDQRGRDRTADQQARNAPGSAGADIGAAELDDTEILGVQVVARSRQRQRGRKVAIKVVAAALEEGTKTAVAQGSVKVGRKRVPLGETAGTIPDGRSLTLTLKPKGKAVAKALKRGKRLKASIEVTVSDEAGNFETVPQRVQLIGKRKGGKGKGGKGKGGKGDKGK